MNTPPLLYVETECPICLDRSKEVALECNHQLCLDCAMRIFKKMKLEKKRSIACHICRQEVSSYKDISEIDSQKKTAEHDTQMHSWRFQCFPFIPFISYLFYDKKR